MNKQRKVVITTTYNEMGIIIDTKAEEVAQTEVAKDTNVLTNDCISRQAAIDALDKRFDSIPMEQTTEILQLRKDLRELPPTQPERKKGRWNPDPINGMKPYGYICNLCGAWQPVERNYCPNCGADMREVDR